jgi:hypothetical protein
MKHFKQFMKDLETTPEEESTEEEVEAKGEAEDDDVKAEDYQDDVRAAWYKGDEAYADHKKANPQMHKKAPVKKKGMQIPKGHIPKDSAERNRDKFYKEK